MTSQTQSVKFIPRQCIDKPDFKRGTMGFDMAVNSQQKGFSGRVVDKDIRGNIADFSKNAKFAFTAHSKFCLKIFIRTHSKTVVFRKTYKVNPRFLLQGQR